MATEYVSIRYFAPVQKVSQVLFNKPIQTTEKISESNKGSSSNETNHISSNNLISSPDLTDKCFSSSGNLKRPIYTLDPEKYLQTPLHSQELLQQYKSTLGLDQGNNGSTHLASHERPVSSLWNLTGGDSNNNSSTLTRNMNRMRMLGDNGSNDITASKSAHKFINHRSIAVPTYGHSRRYNEFLDLAPRDDDFKRFLKIGLITAFVSMLIVAVVVASVLGATLTTNPSSLARAKDQKILLEQRNLMITENINASFMLSNITNSTESIVNIDN